jgi:tetratricopeptide (TPR) repeat protein
MSDKNQQEEIERYLTGKLVGKDLKEFEQQIENDSSFKREVKITKDINERFDDALFAKKLGKIVEPLNEKYIDNHLGDNPSSQSRWLIIALIVVGIVGALVWFNLDILTNQSNDVENISNTDQEIFASYYEPYEPSTVDRSSSVEENMQAILDLYENENYEAVIPLLEPLIEDENANDELKIILGTCYLNTEKTSSAIELFRKMADNDASFINEIGQWYLALAHIKDKNNDLAKPVLEQLSSLENGKYPKLAKEILLKLE